jgi:diguanylate cyclase (GGDEF)-like protein/PAS domain S-box-containing protein
MTSTLTASLPLVPSVPSVPLILVIEDDPGVAALEIELIEDLGCEVAAANSGNAALDWLANSTLAPTLMLMDYSLPDMNGTGLLNRIDERGLTRPPFIVATGAGDEHVAVDLMRRGALNYLIKDHAFLDVLPTALQRAVSDLAMAQRLAAAESRSRLAARILNGTTEGIYVTDEQHRIVETNPAFEAITGFTRDDVIGQLPTLLIAPSADAEQLMQEISSTLTERGHWEGELPLRRKNGSLYFAWFTISQIEGNAGETPSFVTLFNDITQRKQIESELRVAATAFEAQEGMFITDARHVILRVNGAFTRITGYDPDDAVGQTPKLMNSGRHPTEFFAAMTASLAQSGGWQGEIWNRRKNGEIYPEWLTITAVYDDQHRVANYVATLTDITFRKQAEDEIKHLAFFDPLTGLPNRRLMTDRLRHALAVADRHRRHGALMLLDLDNFKNLNDTLGHDAGDQLLVEVARRLEGCMRDGDTVARLGGDEFVVILESLNEDHVAAMQTESVAVKILANLNQPYEIEVSEIVAGKSIRVSRQHQCSASIGIALFDNQEVAAEELLKRADTAMYEAKAAGRDTLCFFDHGMQAVLSARAALESELRHAIVDEQFVVYYQPQVDASGRVTGAESLVRWQHPKRGMVSPAEFIPVAEDTGLILPIGFWVLHQSCQRLADWAKVPEFAHLTLAVNISARQFNMPHLVDEVLSLVEATGAPADRLKLELTESLLLKNTDDVIAKMNELRGHGVRFSLDDFGTGYSSLSYLKALPLDQLKIDQSFVRDVLTDPNDAAIARTIVALADALGLSVIAEGVETDEQRALLGAAGCPHYQGYLFSRPVPIADFEAYVRR